MADPDEKLTPKQAEAIVALLSERSVEEAARVTKIPVRTIHRWIKEPEFDAAYREAKRAAYGQAIARLHQMAGAAVTVLGKVMVDPSTPASTRVRAADSILAHTSKAIEIEDIEYRVAELERAAEGSDKKR